MVYPNPKYQAFKKTKMLTTALMLLPICFTNQPRSLKFCEILGNFNTMIATNTFSVKKMEEDIAKSTSSLKNKFDAPLHHITHTENIVSEILKPKPRQALKTVPNRAVFTFLDTADILESRLGSIRNQVSSIER